MVSVIELSASIIADFCKKYTGPSWARRSSALLRTKGFHGLGPRVHTGFGYKLGTAPQQLDNTYNMVIYSP